MGKRREAGGEWGRVEMSLTSGFDGGGDGKRESGRWSWTITPSSSLLLPSFPRPGRKRRRESVPIFMFLLPRKTHAFEKRGQIQEKSSLIRLKNVCLVAKIFDAFLKCS